VELAISEFDTDALPLSVECVIDESTTLGEPLRVLPSIMERPDTLALPFKVDPLRSLDGPATEALPHTAESRDTKTESFTAAVVATWPPPFPCTIISCPPHGPWRRTAFVRATATPLHVHLPLMQLPAPSQVMHRSLTQIVPASAVPEKTSDASNSSAIRIRVSRRPEAAFPRRRDPSAMAPVWLRNPGSAD
jgi:hypothetical protein